MQSKQTKSRAILLSVLVVVMCLAVILGATFALFTSRREYQIGVNTGKIDVQGELTLTRAWSQGQSTNEREEATVTDNTATLPQGGTVAITDGSNITINNMSLGDGAAFELAVTNASAVDMKYSVTVVVNAGGSELRQALQFSVDGVNKSLEDDEVSLLDWQTVEAGQAIPEEDATLAFEISLPWSALEVFDPAEGEGVTEPQSVSMTVVLEALQANAYTGTISVGDTTYETLAEAMAQAADNETVSLGRNVNATWLTQEEAAQLGDKPLAVVGAGESLTTIEAADNGTLYIPANVTLKDVTVEGNVVATSNASIEDATINGSVTISDDQTAGISTMSLMAFSNAATEAEGGTAMFDGVTFKGSVTATNANVTIVNSSMNVSTTDTSAVMVSVNGGSLTLENNSFAMNGGAMLIYAYNNAEVTIESGSYNASNKVLQALNAVVTINGGTYANTAAANLIHLGSTARDVTDGAVLTVNNGTFNSPNGYAFTVFSNSEVTFNNGTVNAGQFAFSGNNQNDETSSITVNGGSVTAGLVFYMPSNTNLTITGGNYSGWAILDMRMGVANISISGNASFVSTWDSLEVLDYEATAGGASVDGSAFMFNLNRYRDNETGSNGAFNFTLGENVTVQSATGRIFNIYDWNDPDNILEGEQEVNIDLGAYANDFDAVAYYEYMDGEVVRQVAMSNGVPYVTIAAALDAGATDLMLIASNEMLETVSLGGGTYTVTVCDNVIYLATFSVSADANVTISGFGGTIQGSGDETIKNHGTLTINEGVTIDNVTHGKTALYNDVGGVATLNGGTLIRSQETGEDADTSGGNSYYTLLNHGTMTIESGVVENTGTFSSMIENGWYNGNQNTTKVESVMVINGGTFRGGLNTVKNDDYGVITINGGVFENIAQSCVLNWNVATINGGEYQLNEGNTAAVFLNGYIDDTMDQGMLTITHIDSCVCPENKPLIGLMGGAVNGGTITVGDAETLAAAVNVADKVVLCADIVIVPQGSGASLVPQITITNDVTLDLQNYTISLDYDEDAEYTYTIAIMAISGADVVIEGNGTIDAEAGYNNSYAINILNNGSLTVNGGSIYGATTAIQVQSGKLTINGGFFDLAKTIKQVAPQYAKYIVNCIDAAFNDGTAVIELRGGTFGYDFSNKPEGGDSSYVAEGFVSEQNAEGYWDVVPASEEQA